MTEQTIQAYLIGGVNADPSHVVVSKPIEYMGETRIVCIVFGPAKYDREVDETYGVYLHDGPRMFIDDDEDPEYEYANFATVMATIKREYGLDPADFHEAVENDYAL